MNPCNLLIFEYDKYEHLFIKCNKEMYKFNLFRLIIISNIFSIFCLRKNNFLYIIICNKTILNNYFQ